MSDYGQDRMADLYPELWDVHRDGRYAVLDESLHPRGGDMLFDLAKQAGLEASHHVLDVGCGRGEHALELARRFGCRVTGIDPVEANIEEAQKRLAEAGLQGLVSFQQAGIETIPFELHQFDLLWCRDVLVHVAKPGQAMHECARVLKPGSPMLVHGTYATRRLSDQESTMLRGALQIVPENLSRAYMEWAFKDAGFQLALVDEIHGEWLEKTEEQTGRYGRELLRLARLLRDPERYIELLGEDRYHMALGLYHWSIYLLLGKLTSVVYLLKNAHTH